MTGEVLINVAGLSRRFGRHRAVDDVSFSVQRGEVLGFLGPNGAGKTTTMQMICGILASSGGKVAVVGHDIINNARQAKTHIGFLPEIPPLYPHLTVDEYLHYCAQLRRVDRTNIHSALARVKARCGLSEAGRRLIKNLSKGYQQRVGIAQAIVHSPTVVILDEPTSGLDPKQIVEIRRLIRELGEEHSVILSTHILQEVQESCDRVLIMNKGRLIMDRRIDQLNQGKPHKQLSIALKQAPTLAELAGIAGIDHVEPSGKGRFRVRYAADQDMPVILSGLAAQNAWGLYELRPEADDLESIFIGLTQNIRLEQAPS